MGLREYDETDPLFARALPTQLMLTGAFTLTWYIFARQFRVFGCNALLNRSVAIAAVPAFMLSKGIAYHYVAVKDSLQIKAIARERELNNYRRELRQANSH